MNNMHVLINSYKKNLKLKVQQLWIKLLSSTFSMQLNNLSPYHTLALPTLTRVRSGFTLSRYPILAILLSLQCKRKTVLVGNRVGSNKIHTWWQATGNTSHPSQRLATHATSYATWKSG